MARQPAVFLDSKDLLAQESDAALRPLGLWGFEVVATPSGADVELSANLKQLAQERDLDLERSWLIGAFLSQVQAGRRAGCGTVLLDVGRETGRPRSPLGVPVFIVTSLAEAAGEIIRAEKLLRARAS